MFNNIPPLAPPNQLFKTSQPPASANPATPTALPSAQPASDQFRQSLPTGGSAPHQSLLASEIRLRGTGVTQANARAVEEVPGNSWIGRLSSNGNRDTAILMPEGLDLKRPVELIYYFHGHNSSIASVITSKTNGIKDELLKAAQQRNAIVVIPQGPPKKSDYTWMNPKSKEDMGAFQTEVENTLFSQLAPQAQIGSRTVKGHSAGGLPLMYGAVAGTLKADRLDFLDASYGNWASAGAKAFLKNNPQGKAHVTYIPNTGTQVDALLLKKQPGVTLHTSKVAHSAVPRAFFNQP